MAVPVAQSLVQAAMGMKVVDNFRLPEGPPICELITVGAVVETSYGTGPYYVIGITGPHFDDEIAPECPFWSLQLIDANKPVPHGPVFPAAWINEIVALDGRLLKLFGTNSDEVRVIGFSHLVAHRMAPPVQIEMFTSEGKATDVPASYS